jgi:hypothetical protein
MNSGGSAQPKGSLRVTAIRKNPNPWQRLTAFARSLLSK